jgi:hypothetical protein
MKWIKDWSLIAPYKQYLVLAANRAFDEDSQAWREWFSGPQLLDGWQVARLFQGAYAAMEIEVPGKVGDCL